MKIVCFHNPEEENGYLSNWYSSQFIINDIIFSSMEQFMLSLIHIFPELSDHEVVLATSDDYDKDTITVGDYTYPILQKQHFSSENGHWMDNQVYYMVVNSVEDMAPLYEAQKEIYGKNASSYYYSLYIDIDGNREEKIACGNAVSAAIGASGMEEGHDGKYYIMIEKRAENEDSFRQMYCLLYTSANSGMPCISVTWGFRDVPFLKEHGATHLAASAEELYAILDEFNA